MILKVKYRFRFKNELKYRFLNENQDFRLKKIKIMKLLKMLNSAEINNIFYND